MSADDRNKFDSKLWMPPAGVEPASGPWSEEAEMAEFLKFETPLS